MSERRFHCDEETFRLSCKNICHEMFDSLFCLKSLVNMFFFLFIRLPIHLRCSALVQENRGAEVDLRFVSLFAGSHFMFIYSELS